MKDIEVALYEPEIPQNTGNIGRLCVGFDVPLSLVGPLGFEINEKRVRRAGLDYWVNLRYRLFPNPDDFLNEKRDFEIVGFSKTAETAYFDYEFKDKTILLFGPETRGLPPEFLKKHKIPVLKIPMLGPIRSHNLANSVAMALAEIYRKKFHQPPKV